MVATEINSILRMLNSNQKKLIINNMTFAENIARKYYKLGNSRGMSYDEMKSSAYFGLTEAAQKFDETKQVKFQTFAYNFIKGQILRDINIQVFENLQDCLNVVAEQQDINDDEMREIVRQAIDTVLTKRERKVIRWTYGIDCEPMTFTEISRQLHLSKDNVIRIHKSAFDKLKKYVNNNKFNKI